MKDWKAAKDTQWMFRFSIRSVVEIISKGFGLHCQSLWCFIIYKNSLFLLISGSYLDYCALETLPLTTNPFMVRKGIAFWAITKHLLHIITFCLTDFP
jgi:hypothetical protein